MTRCPTHYPRHRFPAEVIGHPTPQDSLLHTKSLGVHPRCHFAFGFGFGFGFGLASLGGFGFSDPVLA
jgi:hypothetical protein